MGSSKRNKQEKAANRRARRQRQNQSNSDDPNENFEDDVPKMKFQLEKLGLVLKEVEGDGNCLFRALSDQLYGCPDHHKRLRQEVVQYMRNHREDFEPFHDENDPFDHHLELLQEDGTYAGNDVLVAFSRSHNVTIVIHQLNEPLWHISPNGEEKQDRELHISYHNGDHYNSIRKRGQLNSLAPPNIQIQIKGDVPDSSLWGNQGTGSRIFGTEVSQEARKGQKKMSAKAKKKYEKRHASRPDPIDDGIPSVEGLNI